jgi:hypothetical protein
VLIESCKDPAGMMTPGIRLAHWRGCAFTGNRALSAPSPANLFQVIAEKAGRVPERITDMCRSHGYIVTTGNCTLSAQLFRRT